MSMEVEKEPEEFGEADLELCCFCWRPTSYWYTPKDVAVCPPCAAKHSSMDVPAKEEWCRKVNEKLTED